MSKAKIVNTRTVLASLVIGLIIASLTVFYKKDVAVEIGWPCGDVASIDEDCSYNKEYRGFPQAYFTEDPIQVYKNSREIRLGSYIVDVAVWSAVSMAFISLVRGIKNE